MRTSHIASADLRDFANVDRVADAAPLVRALDVGKASPGMRAVGGLIMERLRLKDAGAVLDVGCGPGIDTLEMAARLPRGGRAEGVDRSQSMIAEARRRAAAGGQPVTFTAASALNLPFDNGVFDRVRAQSLLLHVSDAQRVVEEIARVLTPGGRAVAFEFDLGTAFVEHPDRDTTEKLLTYVAGASHLGWAGRQLRGMYQKSGFGEVTVTPYVVLNEYAFFSYTMRQPLARLVKDGVLGARQAVAWMEQLARLHETGSTWEEQPDSLCLPCVSDLDSQKAASCPLHIKTIRWNPALGQA